MDQLAQKLKDGLVIESVDRSTVLSFKFNGKYWVRSCYIDKKFMKRRALGARRTVQV